MRIFYNDEGAIDTLLQIADQPINDGDLVSKSARDTFVNRGWVCRSEGLNIITPEGWKTIMALRLRRP